MELLAVTDDAVEQFSADIPELMWSTGPISYEYHFGTRELLNAVALGSWRHRGSLFGFDAATVAVEDGRFMGVEIGMNGAEYRDRQAALGPVWQKLIADGDIDRDVIPGVLQRSDHASWLNPVIHADTYYVHALAVKPEFRGKRVGYQLIDGAIKRAKSFGNGGYAAISGLPHITIPAYQIDGYPVGVSVIGRPWEDLLVLQVAAVLETFFRGRFPES